MWHVRIQYVLEYLPFLIKLQKLDLQSFLMSKKMQRIVWRDNQVQCRHPALHKDNRPVRLAYKQYFFSQRTIFFSHNKSTNNTFRHDLSAERTGHQQWTSSMSWLEQAYRWMPESGSCMNTTSVNDNCGTRRCMMGDEEYLKATDTIN